MKWVYSAERLPRHGVSTLVELRTGRYVKMEFNGCVSKDWWEINIIRWLDESEPTFTISDLILAWAKAQEITIENTSYDVNSESVDPDYSYIEKERNDFFKKQFSVDINK